LFFSNLQWLDYKMQTKGGIELFNENLLKRLDE
jgi:hypothetical protein